MNTEELMKQLMILLDGVTDPDIAGEIILPILKEYGEGIPDEILTGMSKTLFLEIVEEKNRVNSIGKTAIEEKQAEEHGAETFIDSDNADSVDACSNNVMETVFYQTMAVSDTPQAITLPERTEQIDPASENPSTPFPLPSVPSSQDIFVPDKNDQPLDEQMFPRWIVDWGGSLPMSGALLSPKFLILSPYFQSKPRVQMELDERLTCPYWNRAPSLSLETDGAWSYYEQLNISTDENYTAGREYLLRVRVVFHEDEGRGVHCFQGTMRIKAPDQSRTQRTLEISGDGASLINLSSADLAEFQRVRITGGDQTLVNVQRGWTSPDTDKSEPRHHLVEMQLKPDMVAGLIVPRKSSISVVPFHSERIVLTSENDEQIFYIFAKPNLLIGRSAEETLTGDACDIVTRLYHPKFEEINYFDENLIRASRFLTRLISRNHCGVEVMPRGLRISDMNSTLGTFIAGQPLDNSQILAEWKYLERGLSVVIGGLLEFIIKTHIDPTWRRISSLNIFRNEEIEEFYTQVAFGDSLSFHAQGMSGLWKLAVDQGGCDAIVISRQKQLVFDRYREVIADRIHSYTDRATSVLNELETSLRHCTYDPFAKSCEYIVLFRSATIGSGRDDAISLPNSGLGEDIARILSINKMFWIEPLRVDYHSIRIDDHVLKRNELCPLVPNQKLFLGNQMFFIKTFDMVNESCIGIR